MVDAEQLTLACTRCLVGGAFAGHKAQVWKFPICCLLVLVLNEQEDVIDFWKVPSYFLFIALYERFEIMEIWNVFKD